MAEFMLTMAFIGAAMASFVTNYLLFTRLEAEQRLTRRLRVELARREGIHD